MIDCPLLPEYSSFFVNLVVKTSTKVQQLFVELILEIIQRFVELIHSLCSLFAVLLDFSVKSLNNWSLTCIRW